MQQKIHCCDWAFGCNKALTFVTFRKFLQLVELLSYGKNCNQIVLVILLINFKKSVFLLGIST